ncbi:MAG: glycosyltransferase family 4 protein [Sulfitobacter sp.]
MPKNRRRVLILVQRCIFFGEDSLAVSEHKTFRGLAWAGFDVIVATQPGLLEEYLGRRPKIVELEAEKEGLQYIHLCADPEQTRAERRSLYRRLVDVFSPAVVISAAGENETDILLDAVEQLRCPTVIYSETAPGQNSVLAGRAYDVIYAAECEVGTKQAQRSTLLKGALDRLSRHRSAAETGGASALEELLWEEAQGDSARFVFLMEIAAQSIFVEKSPSLGAHLYKRLFTSFKQASHLKAAFSAAKKAQDFELLLSLTDKVLEQEKGEAGDRSLVNPVEDELAEIILLQRRLEKAKHIPIRQTKQASVIAYMVHSSLPFVSMGYATRSQGLLAAIHKAGVNVFCVTRPGFPADMGEANELAPPSWEVDGVKYFSIPQPRLDTSARFKLDSVDAVKKKMQELGATHVVSASNHQIALPSLIAARELGLPFIYEVRGFWELTRLSREPEYAQTLSYKRQVFLETLTATHAQNVVTLTEGMKQELLRRGVDASNIHLAPNAVDCALFTPQSRDEELATKIGISSAVPVIGYVGSLLAYEGLDDLVRAAGILRAQGRVFRLLIVGDEGNAAGKRMAVAEMISSIANEVGISDWLIMPGRVPHEEVKRWYSLIDIAPFPRKSQPVTETVPPLKPLEAMAMGKPVIVSDVAPLKEMIDTANKRGAIFTNGDYNDLARKLDQLLTAPELGHDRGKAAREWVLAERSWAKTSARLLKAVPGLVHENLS